MNKILIITIIYLLCWYILDKLPFFNILLFSNTSVTLPTLNRGLWVWLSVYMHLYQDTKTATKARWYSNLCEIGTFETLKKFTSIPSVRNVTRMAIWKIAYMCVSAQRCAMLRRPAFTFYLFIYDFIYIDERLFIHIAVNIRLTAPQGIIMCGTHTRISNYVMLMFS